MMQTEYAPRCDTALKLLNTSKSETEARPRIQTSTAATPGIIVDWAPAWAITERAVATGSVPTFQPSC